MNKTISAVYKLYILLLPFQLLPVFRAVKQSLSAFAALDNCMFIMLFGLLLLILYSRGTLYFQNELLKKSVVLVFSLILISLITSVILLPSFGTLYGENTLKASFSTNIYYLLIAVTFYYNANLFDFVEKKTFQKLMDLLCVINIVIGAIQIAIVMHVPGLAKLYDSLDVLDILEDSRKLLLMGRVCSTRVEPANMGISICVFLLPYAMSQFLHNKHNQKYLFFIIGLTLLCFYALSSAVAVVLMANYMMFVFFSARKTGVGKFIVLLILILIVFVTFVGSGALDNTEFGRQLSFLLLEKTTDTSNLSSGYRYTTVVNDFICFIKYPVSGVGNGNQGFLYNSTMNLEWVPESMRTNYQTVNAMNGNYGVLSGGAFVPGFISGYGILGITLLAAYFGAVRKKLRQKREELDYLYEWFYIGSISFAVVSTVAGAIEGNFIVMFVLSLPFAAEHNFKQKGALKPNG